MFVMGRIGARLHSVLSIRAALIAGLSLFTVLSSLPCEAANDYPNKAIKLIVPNAPGGPTDIFARALADALSSDFSQPVVVDNRSGAGGITAFGLTANSPPDGYTLVVVDPSVTILPSLYASLPYDTEKDLTPISLFVRGTTALVVRKSLEVSDPSELVALAKREPGKLTYGSAGNGSFPQLNAELFKLLNAIDIKHVPYRGGAPAMTDLIAGRIDMFWANVGISRSYIEDGSVKALAVGGKTRTARLPNVVTYYEGNLPEPEFDLGAWWGVMGPGKLPAEIQEKLNQAINKALENPQLLKRFDEMSADPLPSTPKEFSDLIVSERVKWAEVIKKANIKPE